MAEPEQQAKLEQQAQPPPKPKAISLGYSRLGNTYEVQSITNSAILNPGDWINPAYRIALVAEADEQAVVGGEVEPVGHLVGDGEEEVAALGGNPTRAVWGEGATGDDPMDMDVMLERLPPGMEHQGEADLTAEPPGITAKGLQGGCSALKEEAVEDLGIALSQGIELMGQGQHAMEIGNV